MQILSYNGFVSENILNKGYLRNLLKHLSSVYNIGGEVKKPNWP